MDTTNIDQKFVQAAREKLRFDSGRGQVTVEDLFDFNLKSLDTMAVAVAELAEPRTRSFLTNPDKKASREAQLNTLRLDILTFIITSKEAENRDEVARRARTAQRDFLKKLADKKRVDELEGLSLEEIEAQLAAIPADEEG